MEESQEEQQELAQPEVQEEIQEEIQEQTEVNQPEEKESPQEINWKQAQQALRMQKQKIDELEARLAEQQMQRQQPADEPDELADLDPSDYVTVEKAQKLAQKKAREEAKKIVSEYMQQQNLNNDEQRMRAKHADYDYVLENYAIPLIKQDPALAYKIQSSKNPAETAYRLGRLADNFEELPVANKENPKKAEKIVKNASRPTSGNALGSPLKAQADAAMSMTPAQVWEMSQKYARGA